MAEVFIALDILHTAILEIQIVLWSQPLKEEGVKKTRNNYIWTSKDMTM